MSASSPGVILYDLNGNPLAVQNAVAIPANTPALIIAGSDGTNSRFITVDASGHPIIVGLGTAGTPSGGVISVQGVSGGTNLPVSQGTSPWVDNITQFGGTNISTGTGAGGAGIPRVTVSNDSNVLVTQSTSPWVDNISQIGGNPITILAAGEQKVAVEGLAASGAATSGNPILVAGSDGTNARNIRTDTVGYVQIIYNQFSTTTTTATISGQVTPSSSSTATVVRKTPYTEQTANFTGSVSSTSASDTSAGTGARTVTITYYDQAGAGPNTETVTLNGTTAVNLVNSNHCFIEKIVIATAGSTGSNVGIISLFTGAGGTGTVVGTIAATDNQTFWAHHYIPSGKTNFLTQMLLGTTGNQTTYFYMTKKSVLVANAIEYQITEKMVNAQGTDTASRIYYSPLQTPGFSRITMYVVSNGNNTTYFGSFDYGDQ